jgi:dipeptidyl aminopeptidase/acylaminoacyl peptidase
VRVYTRCVTLEDGCVYRPNTTVWQQVAETNRGGDPVSVSVQGTDDAGAAVGKSASATLQFSKDDVRGGLYYWTTSQVDTVAGSPQSAIMRWDFASTTQVKADPFIVPRLAGDNKTCVGCHAISRDGSKLVATLGGQNDGRIVLWDVAKKTQMAYIPDMPRSQFESWSPDATQFVGMYTDKDAAGKDLHTGPSNLILFDGTTAMKTGSIDLGGLRADHPDWSPDGKRIVFTSVDTAGTYTDQRPQKSGLAYIDQTASGWSPPTTLLPSAPGKNRYYPAIAPTNKFMVFDESSCASGDTGDDCDGDTDPTAMLYGLPLPAVAGAVPVALAHANAPGVNDAGATALTNTYPKWSPFVFQLDEQRQVLWATFSSKRRYGLYKNNGNLFIWMVAVNPASLAGGDPSYTAFCLPFQDITTSNHIAQWTTFIPIVM